MKKRRSLPPSPRLWRLSASRRSWRPYALLGAALDVACAALIAAHPELLRSEHSAPSTDAVPIAATIIQQARALGANQHRFRIALVVDPGLDGPIPF